ncbi:MAG: UpxY family transcription antiterminator [Bacteroides sp.]|nr:UpxY family transcription antiterminator [Bacteroides sp.]MCM1094710.1 UpxY family transcription antiterminator [Terasakiella sp.]
MPAEHDTDTSRWYALNVRPGREFDTRDRLSSLVDAVYLPLAQTIDSRGHKVERPAVSRLLFVQAPAGQLLDLEREALQSGRPFYIYRDAGHTTPQAIPDSEMRMFMLVSSAPDAGLLFIDTPGTAYATGQRVRVTDGIFKGAEGRVRRVRRDRRVVVQIEGICAVALPFLHSSLLQPLD